MQELQVKYTNGALYHCQPEWDWHFGPMVDYDLWVVLTGKGYANFKGLRQELVPGSIFLFNPGNTGYITHDPENPLQVAAIHFDFIGSPLIADIFYTQIEQIGFLGELMQQAIIAAGNSLQADADFWLTAALRKVFPVKPQDNPPRFQKEIDRLCSGIINQPEKSYHVEDMAKELCICKDHFARIFKSLKKISPRDFIIRARIKKARFLLLNTNMNASEIANLLGYSSVNFFCRQFKAQTGKTVLAFRRQM